MEDSGHCTYNCKLVCLTLYSTLPPSNKEGEKERKGGREGVRESENKTWKPAEERRWAATTLQALHLERGADLIPEAE